MHARDLRAIAYLPAFLLFVPFSASAQTLRSEYLNHIKTTAGEAWKEYPQVIERWKKAPNHHELWGYDAPAFPVYLADLLGFLYQETKDKSYAEKARDILARYGDLRETYPKELQATRAEYRNGVPAIATISAR